VVIDLPVPGVTDGGPEEGYEWAHRLNQAIQERYEDALQNISVEANTRAADDLTLQEQIDQRMRTLAYAEDTANAAIALGVGVFTPLLPTFAVPPTDYNVILRWGGTVTITAAGNGTVALGPADVTSGAAPATLQGFAGPAGAFLAGVFSAGPQITGEQDVGASATWRVFRLYGFVGRDAASALAASLRASGANPANTKSWMRAILA
jgi:hypothetical protein